MSTTPNLDRINAIKAAETERLSNELRVAVAERETAREARYAAEDEIERLRAALQRIVDEADSHDGLTAWDGSDIARAALSADQSQS